MVCVALRFLASGMFLYSVGDAENRNKGTICRTIRNVSLALKSLAHIFITFPGHIRFLHIKEVFYKIAGEFSGVLLGDPQTPRLPLQTPKLQHSRLTSRAVHGGWPGG
ncbi:hypothetical protein cypCar_00019337 [Cyprinus carpio]|nr:hypothetical protein cypCar_00019337 [Cyprinus carpio]